MCLGRFPPPFPGTCSTLLDYVAVSNHYLAFVEEPIAQPFVVVPPHGLIIKDSMYIQFNPRLALALIGITRVINPCRAVLALSTVVKTYRWMQKM